MSKTKYVKSVLNKTKRRDPWFLDDYTLNLYSSCSFNCLYCYIRGSKYGTNLSSSLTVKINAIDILERQLANRAKKNQHGIIVLSSATDPYLSLEKEYELTRQALQAIAKYRFPVHIITKSDLVKRDFDILHEINERAITPHDLPVQQGVIISFSFSTLNDKIAQIFEPGARPPSARLHAIKASLKEGFLTGISLMPLLPFISDTTAQLNLFFETFKQLKVDYMLPATLTLYGSAKADSKTLVLKAIQKHFPELEDRYNKYFQSQQELPSYYREAFKIKMNELCQLYEISNSILKCPKNKK